MSRGTQILGLHPQLLQQPQVLGVHGQHGEGLLPHRRQELGLARPDDLRVPVRQAGIRGVPVQQLPEEVLLAARVADDHRANGVAILEVHAGQVREVGHGELRHRAERLREVERRRQPLAGLGQELQPAVLLLDGRPGGLLGQQPLVLLLGAVAKQRHLDHDAQLALLERLEQVAVGLRDLRPAQGGVVRVGGHVHHGDVELAANQVGRLDAVHLAPQPDVHQHQRGGVDAHALDGPRAGAHTLGDPVAQPDEAVAQIHRDDVFVLDDEDGFALGAHRAPLIGNVTTTSVPPATLNSTRPSS